MADGIRITIIYLDRSTVSVYSGGKIYTTEFPVGAVKDIDVMDKSGLGGALDSFIKTNKINPDKSWIILSEAISFTKEIEEKDPPKLEAATKSFLEAVPFDQVISNTYKSAKGITVIASNLDLVEAIVDIFEHEGFNISGVVPAQIFPSSGARRTFDENFVKTIHDNINSAASSNMLHRASEEKVVVSEPENHEVKGKSKTLPYLIGIFAFLLIVLVIALLTRN